MEIYIEKQLINIVYSLILGLIFGVIYDIIRIIHILLGIASYSGEKKGMKRGTLPFLLFLLLDTVYVISAVVIYSIFNYFACNGEFRVFILASVCAGFASYYVTVGRLVMFFSEAIAGLLKKIIYYVLVIPLKFLTRIAARMMRFTYKNTLGRVVCAFVRFSALRRTERYRRTIVRDICFKFKDLEEAK